MAKKFFIPEDEYVVQPKKEDIDKKTGVSSLPISDLIMDEENAVIYGGTQTDIHALSEEIKENGFKGVILAYPFTTDSGEKKYRIESGHRRFLAAKEAGLTTIPVMLTEQPKNEMEQTIRLIKMNLHNRTYVPSIKAKEIISLIDCYKKLYELRGEKISIAALMEKVAHDEELSVKSVEKYREFAKLIPELQTYADRGIPWSALIQCYTFPEEKQQSIAAAIKTEEEKIGSIESISSQWVVSLINRVRQDMLGAPVKQKSIVKRRDGQKIIGRWNHDIEDIMNGNVVFKDKKEAIENLQKIQECIEKKISELAEE